MEPTISDKIIRLREAIEGINGLPDSQREKLLQSLSDLETAVPAGDDSHLPLLGQLEESLIGAEVKHPEAAQMLRGLGDALGRMGL